MKERRDVLPSDPFRLRGAVTTLGGNFSGVQDIRLGTSDRRTND